MAEVEMATLSIKTSDMMFVEVPTYASNIIGW